MPSSSVHPAATQPDALLEQCDVRRLRRSGPGGQHRNKVETAIALVHQSTGVTAEANERRSQAENRSVAIHRLRVNLALEVRCSRPVEEVPSDLWQSRCFGGRIQVSTTHDDFPTLLAEALDLIAEGQADVKAAGAALGCTTSQLVKFLKQEPQAMALVNRWREAEGLRRLQ